MVERARGHADHGERDRRHAVTVLFGHLVDQAALLGVLNALYELGLPLLSVGYLAPRSR